MPFWLRLLQVLIGVVMFASFALIGSWIAFGPGPRNFGTNIPFLASGVANEIAGRCAFGIGAILSSQRVSDFSDSILETPGNHLCLQVNTADAQRLAHLLAPGKRAEMQTTLQSLGKFRGVFRNEDHPGGVVVSLAAPEGDQ